MFATFLQVIMIMYTINTNYYYNFYFLCREIEVKTAEWY